VNAALAVGAGGVALALATSFLAGTPLAEPYLVAWTAWALVPIGALALLVTHHVLDAGWSRSLVYPLAGLARTLPLVALAFLPVLLALGELYPWTAPEAELAETVAAKTAWLNVPFFTARALGFLVVLSALALLLAFPRRRRARIAAVGAVVYTLAASFAVVDWMMSLEPEFSSSNYGLHVLGHAVLTALALAIAAVLLAKGSLNLDPAGRAPNTAVMSAVLLGVLMLWAYLLFMSYLVIWSGNVPHYVAWWEHRTGGVWPWLLAVVIVGGGAVPFALLLNRAVRRHERALLWICLVIVATRLVYTAWLTLPAFEPGPAAAVTAAALVAGVGGFWLASFLWLLPRPAEARDG
jgi:hypothetical protein